MKKNKWTIPATIELEYDIPEGSDAVKEVRNCVWYLPPCARLVGDDDGGPRVGWCGGCDEQRYSDMENGAGTRGSTHRRTDVGTVVTRDHDGVLSRRTAYRLRTAPLIHCPILAEATGGKLGLHGLGTSAPSATGRRVAGVPDLRTSVDSGRAVDHAAAHSDAHSLRLSPRSRRNLPDASGRLAAVLMSQFG